MIYINSDIVDCKTLEQLNYRIKIILIKILTFVKTKDKITNIYMLLKSELILKDELLDLLLPSELVKNHNRNR
mgnify:CR=1 FL=1